MKKLLLLCVLSLLLLPLSAQVKTETDQFTGEVKKSTNYEVLCRNWSGTLKMKINQVDTLLLLTVMVEPMSMVCMGENCSVQIKSGNDIINLDLSDNINCGSQGSFVIGVAELDNQTKDVLSGLTVSAIRVNFTEGYSDFQIKKKDYFIRNMKLF
jgi:hypothetical protein